jgi:ubiquinone biosynthesis protein
MKNLLQLLKFFLFLIFIIIINPSIFIPSRRSKALNNIFSHLGPAFIKFGQLMSTRPDIIGEKLTSDLKDLQDNIHPFSKKEIDKTFLRAYNKLPNKIFDEFYYENIGSASIAQVHKAKKNNIFYAIKILRPNIEHKIQKNIQLLRVITNFFHDNFNKKYQRFRLPDVINFLERNLMHEIDLTFEGASATQLRINLLSDSEVYIPEIYWDLTNREILVMEWIDATPISQISKTNLDKKIILTNLINTFCNQAYRDGVFHADMHPGNILVDKNCRIILIDFGIIGRMDKKTKFYITEILRGFLRHDYKLIAKMHFDAGYVDSKYSIDEFENACRAIGEQIVGKNLENLSIGNLFTNLLKLTQSFNMETRIELLLIQKATILIEGVAKNIEPKMNIWKLSDSWLRAHYMTKSKILQRAFHKHFEKFYDKIIEGISYFENRRKKYNSLEIQNYSQKIQKEKSKNIKYFDIILIILIIYLIFINFN